MSDTGKRTGGMHEHSPRQSLIDDFLEEIIMRDFETKNKGAIEAAKQGLEIVDTLRALAWNSKTPEINLAIAESKFLFESILYDLKVDEEETILSYGLEGLI